MATYDLRGGTLYLGGTNTPAPPAPTGSVYYTGSGYVDAYGRQLGQPVYQTVQDPEAYNRYATGRASQFQEQFKAQQTREEAALQARLRTQETQYSVKEKFRQQIEAGTEAPQIEIVKRFQGKRAAAFSGYQQGQVNEFNKNIAALYESQKAVVTGEIESKKEAFTKQVEVGRDYSGDASIKAATQQYYTNTIAELDRTGAEYLTIWKGNEITGINVQGQKSYTAYPTNDFFTYKESTDNVLPIPTTSAIEASIYGQRGYTQLSAEIPAAGFAYDPAKTVSLLGQLKRGETPKLNDIYYLYNLETGLSKSAGIRASMPGLLPPIQPATYTEYDAKQRVYAPKFINLDVQATDYYNINRGQEAFLATQYANKGYPAASFGLPKAFTPYTPPGFWETGDVGALLGDVRGSLGYTPLGQKQPRVQTGYFDPSFAVLPYFGLSIAKGAADVGVNLGRGFRNPVGAAAGFTEGINNIFIVRGLVGTGADIVGSAAYDPVGFTGESIGAYYAYGGITKGLLKGYGYAKGYYGKVNAPIEIRPPKFNIIEERIITGADKFQVKGTGFYTTTTTTKFRQLFNRAPTVKSQLFDYRFNVEQASSVPKAYNVRSLGLANLSGAQEYSLMKQYGLKAGKVPNYLKGSPQTLEGLVPEQTFNRLLNIQTDYYAGLRGTQKFVSKGYVDIYGAYRGKAPGNVYQSIVGKDILGIADRRIIKDVSYVTGKKPSVYFSASELPELAGKQTFDFAAFGTKIRSFGEQYATGKVSGIIYGEKVGKYTQNINFGNTKINVEGILSEGKATNYLDFGKISAYSQRQLDSLNRAFGFGEQTTQPVYAVPKYADVAGTVTKPAVVSSVGKTINDVYGITVYTTPKVGRTAYLAADTAEYLGTGYDIAVGSIPKQAEAYSRALGNFDLTAPAKSYKTSEAYKVDYATKDLLKESYKPALKQEIKLDLKQDYAPKEAFKETYKDAYKETFKESYKEAVKQATKQTTKQATKQTFKTVTKPPFITTTIRPPRPPIPRRKKGVDEYDFFGKKSIGYLPLVKVKGKFKPIGNVLLPKNLALQKAAKYADVSTARSISAQPAGFIRRKDVNLLLPTFRKGKGKDIYVEKTRFAIDTAGEKAQLKAARKMVAGWF